MRMLAACLALVGALVAGGVSMAATDVIRGSATYRERIALPPGTTLEVELLDVSKADAPSVLIASDSIPVLRQVPIAFALAYDPALIDEKNRYALTAKLMHAGGVLFRSTAITPVLTHGAEAGAAPEILLVQSEEPAPEAEPATEPDDAAAKPAEGGEAAAAAAEVPADMAAVAGTWIASEINGAATDEKVVSWLKLSDAGRAQGQGGCNSFTGTYKLENGTLTFGPLASTRRACPETQMSQEQRFFAALGAVKAARLESGDLVLTDLAGEPLVQLRKK
ncbi:putative lipoprotein [Amaricoccus macauensis]|uniref:Putative lipoprotein n=1 Tax=Amaricoccus macauensis TaxID=57001 RepID=A0A840SMQ2_9RHOB|nr:META domain-containing protein [Amaricoccus macauensis]MBB5221146.1 putative lipoprotein [Amaricoccus macauensis]